MKRKIDKKQVRSLQVSMEKTYCRRKGYFGKMCRKNCAKLYRAY